MGDGATLTIKPILDKYLQRHIKKRQGCSPPAGNHHFYTAMKRTLKGASPGKSRLADFVPLKTIFKIDGWQDLVTCIVINEVATTRHL
jgi:hypothetical protein